MKLIITIISLVAFTNLFSQDFKRIETQFGFGPTISIPYQKTVEPWPGIIDGPKTVYSSNFGYFLEYNISYNISHRIAFTSGLNFNFNQFKIADKIGVMERKGKRTNSNLCIPVFIRYRLSSNIPLLLSAGPYFNALIHAREKGTLFIDTSAIVIIGEPDPYIESMNPIQKYDNNTTKQYPSFDYGLSAQLDYEFKLKEKINAVVYSRFNYGTKRKTGSNLESVSTSTYWRNYSVMIGFGIKL